MIENNNFDKEYFIQTRREIDTEKQERDHLLNFALIVLGALGFAFVQSENAQEFLKQPYSLMFEISTLVIITSLFWVRRKKLQQISDRWFTLYRIALRNKGENWIAESMEGIVIRGLKTYRYLIKDIVLNIALSLPIYGLLFVSSSGFELCSFLKFAVPLIVIIVHLIFSLTILGKRFRDPFEKLVIKKDDKSTPQI